MKVRVTMMNGSDEEFDVYYVKVGTLGELILIDMNGLWTATFAPGTWRRVKRLPGRAMDER